MNKIKISIFCSVFVAMLGLMLIAPIMPSLIRELGLQEIHSGFIISLGSVAMAVMAPLWGRWSDRKGRKLVILIGFAGMSISCLLFTLVLYSGLQAWLGGTLLVVLLIVTRALVGACIPAILSPSQAYMSDVTSEQERSSGMAVIGAANGMGLIFGPATAGAFIWIGLLWPLYFGIVLAAAAFLMVLWMMPPAPAPVRNGKPAAIRMLQPSLRFYLLTGLSTMIGIVTLQVIGGFYFQDQLQLSATATAQMVSAGLMFSGVAMLIMQIVQMRWLHWNPVRMVAVGGVLMLLGIVCFVIGRQAMVYDLAFFLFGLGAGLLMPGFMAGASLSVRAEQQGSAAGFVAMMQGIAAIIAPLLSTLLYEVNRYIPFMLIGGLLIIVLIAVAGVWRRSVQQQTATR
ncbi:MFS transporter [Paenibacillus sp. WLX2291]|uniref:MFS transporter n=1 Tax=Paenibacillus sp. WLX2291 TaxID=3296934 RepID=UPI00398448AC